MQIETFFKSLNPEQWVAISTLILAIATFVSIFLSLRMSRRALSATMVEHRKTLKDASSRLCKNKSNLESELLIGYDNEQPLLTDLFESDPLIKDLITNHTNKRKALNFSRYWNFNTMLDRCRKDLFKATEKRMNEIFNEYKSLNKLGIPYRQNYDIYLHKGYFSGVMNILKNFCNNALNFKPNYNLGTRLKIKRDEGNKFHLNIDDSITIGVGTKNEMNILENVVRQTYDKLMEDTILKENKVNMLKIFVLFQYSGGNTDDFIQKLNNNDYFPNLCSLAGFRDTFWLHFRINISEKRIKRSYRKLNNIKEIKELEKEIKNFLNKNIQCQNAGLEGLFEKIIEEKKIKKLIESIMDKIQNPSIINMRSK